MLFALLLAMPAEAATHLVAGDGSGDFTTLSDALDAAASGDTIVVEPGTYGPSTGERIPWYFPSYLTIEGAGPGVTVLDAEGEETFGDVLNPGVTISGVTFMDASGSALGFRSEGGLLEDCAFADNADTALVVYDAVVSNCGFLGNSAIDPNGVTSVGGSDAEIVWIEVYDEPEPGQKSVDLQGSSSVDASVFLGGGVRIDGPVSNSMFLGLQALATSDYCILAWASGAWFESNTVVGCSAPLAVYTYYARDNVVAHNEGAGIRAGYAAYNLVYNNAGGNWYENDWSGTLGNIEGDPVFRDFSDDGDWSNDDLRLDEGSPGIDAASGDCPDHDILGVPRPQDGDGDGVYRCDMGAYEWGMIDEDGDGWYLDGGDCDDADAAIHPEAEEIPYDGIDQDCDGEDLVDVDEDGFVADHQGGTDCDDTDADIHPGAWDIPGDGIDQDCDGEDAVDSDGDGWPDDQDCDPDDPSVHPGADEVCENGIDDDCDGEIDEGCDGGDDTGGSDDTADMTRPTPSDDDDRLSACGGCRSGGAALLFLPLVGLLRRRLRHE